MNAAALSFRNVRNDVRQLVSEPFLFGAVIVIFLLLLVFIVYPILVMTKLSFTSSDKQWTLDAYRFIFTHARFRASILNSVILGAIVATLSTIIGFLFAYTVTRTRVPGQKILNQLALLPMISPPFMFALSVILLFGRNGLITAGLLGIDRYNIYGLKGLSIVQTINLFPVAYLTLTGILQGIDPDLETCAMNLGAKPLKTFLTVTLPLALPGILAAWMLVFVGSLTDFGNPMVVGGEFDVLSVQAYLEFTGMANLPRGSALAILLLIPTALIFLLQKFILGKKSYATITGKSSRRAALNTHPVADTLLLILCVLVCLFILMFYGVIIVGSFIKLWGLDYSLTLQHFKYSFDVGMETLYKTLLLAAIATPITSLLGMVIAFLVVRKRFPGKHLLEFLSLLSYAIPGTAIGIGYILAFNKPPLLLSGTALILVINHIFRNIPIGVEAGIAALKQISKDIEESSTNLGATSAYTFKKITLPLITPSFFAGAAYSFVRCMTAISAIVFLVSAKWNHITVLILAQTEIMRLGAASALSVILILVITLFNFVLKKATGLGKERIFGEPIG